TSFSDSDFANELAEDRWVIAEPFEASVLIAGLVISVDRQGNHALQQFSRPIDGRPSESKADGGRREIHQSTHLLGGEMRFIESDHREPCEHLSQVVAVASSTFPDLL